MTGRKGTRWLTCLYLSILAVAFTLLDTSCAWRKDFRQGRQAVERKDWDQAVANFLKAVGEKPDSVELRISLANALIAASNHYLQKGKQFQEENQLKAALVAFDKALEYNPENNEARRRKLSLLKHLKELEKQQREKTELEQLKEKAAAEEPPTPQLEYKEKPYSLKFARADLQQVFKALEKASGVSFIFDESFKTKRVEVNLQDVGFMEALDKLMLQTNLFYKVVDPHTVMIIPDTPAKRRDYEELVMRTMFVSYGNPDEVLKTVRALTGMKTAASDKDLNAITFKGTPEEVQMAERIARIYDKPKGEVFIDIEIIEVNRTRVREYGIELSQYSVTEAYLPETGTGTEAAASTIRLHRLGHTDASDYLLTLPSINYKLLKTDRNSRIKARPQLRVVDGQKIEVRLGDKVPIPTTSFVPYNVGAPNQQPITSYQLQDVGINIELKPKIHHDGLISLEMKFELTFITNPGTERVPPTIGNRSVNTLIKLRDNETSILAGLLRDTERKTLRGFPFLSDIPVLKDIFSGNTNEIEQTDIILTLTPRIIRFPEIDESDLELLWVGTQAKPGLKPPPVQLELPVEEEEKKETEKKTTKKEEKKDQVKTAPKTPAVKPAEPAAAPQPKLLGMFFLTADLKVKKGSEADVSLAISGDHEIKAVTLEIDFDPAVVQVLDVRKGKVLNEASVKSLLLRNIDNQAGKLKFNISLEQALKITPESTGEFIVLRLKPLSTGKVSFKASLVRVLDAGMNKIESECPDKGMEFQVPE
jgi:general secretion pathway protein D